MKKFLFIFLVLFASCSGDVDRKEVDLVDFIDVEKEIHDYFSEMVRMEEGLVWAQVVGAKQSGEGYTVETVFFRRNNEVRKKEYFAEEEEGSLMFEELGSEELEYEDLVVLEEVSKNGRRAYVTKRLVATDFYTFDELVIAGFLGRYDLWIENKGENMLIDSSFDPFSTNIPFEIWKFSEDGNYLEYFIQDFGRLYNIYDIENQEKTDIIVPGLVEDSFWIKDELFICTKSGEFPAVVVHTKAGEWDLEDFKFEHPKELNNSLKNDKLWEDMRNYRLSDELECRLEDGVLRYLE